MVSACYVPGFVSSNVQTLSIFNHTIFSNNSHEFHSVGETDSERLSSFWASRLKATENENLIIQISISRGQIKWCLHLLFFFNKETHVKPLSEK